jgi:predicted AAA+ superfamily ATPase
MAFIQRELEDSIVTYFSQSENQGLILAGIVGSGKTTLINQCLERLSSKYEIFQFTGDDTVFRNQIQGDSMYLHDVIRGKTSGRVFVFIDEVQKSESIFDAIKILFDKGNASFIVSGSNPAFLNSVAKKRLQRRAMFKVLHPLSIPEILGIKELSPHLDFIVRLLAGNPSEKLPRIEKTPKIKAIIEKYICVGGLPLSYLNKQLDDSLSEIQKTFDRGFSPIREDANDITDAVAIELAQLHAKEFTYQHLLNKNRVRQRQVINHAIEALIDHGYIDCVTPYLFCEEKKSYLKKYFFVDPGIVTYLTGFTEIQKELGYKIEGLVYTRLLFHLQRAITKNKGIYFYKHYAIGSHGQLRFSKGEVDAIYRVGTITVPIEIKSSSQWKDIDTKPIESFLEKHKIPYGIVLYGGEPFRKKNVYFWPFWLL